MTEPTTESGSTPGGRIEAIQVLRGLAAFSVAFFHFTAGNPAFYVPTPIRAVGKFGWVGLELFFVISGFILPYSLWTSGYRLDAANFCRFVWKRIVRLDPPYFATIGLVLLLSLLSTFAPGYRGVPFSVNTPALLAHIGYLNDLVRLPWQNPVYWTLAIEFQFYLTVAAVFPAIVNGRRVVRLILTVGMLSAAVVWPHLPSFVPYLPQFVIGIATFQWFTGVCGRVEAIAQMIPAAILTAVYLGWPAAAACLLVPVVVLCAASRTNRFAAWCGLISYSFYLLQAPIGGRVINLFQRLHPSVATSVAGILSAFAVTTGSAWLLWRFVERPAQRYAASLRFNRTTP